MSECGNAIKKEKKRVSSMEAKNCQDGSEVILYRVVREGLM